MQALLVAIIIGISVGYLAFYAWRSFKKASGKKGCSSGCGCGKD